MPRIISGYLIVSGSGELRTTRRVPRLSWNEVAFPLSVKIPDVWGRLQRVGATIEFPDAVIESPTVGVAENLPRVALADD